MPPATLRVLTVARARTMTVVSGIDLGCYLTNTRPTNTHGMERFLEHDDRLERLFAGYPTEAPRNSMDGGVQHQTTGLTGARRDATQRAVAFDWSIWRFGLDQSGVPEACMARW